MSSRITFFVALLAAATLLLETTLTRLLAVAQFYHFAFLVVSLALLGFGASGTLLSVVPWFRKIPLGQLLSYLGVGYVISVGLAYAVVNLLPFDSYSIAWDRRQILFFVLYYLALTLPFVISGLGIGAALSSGEGGRHRIYAANLWGSALGAFLAPVALWMVGVPGSVLVSGLLGLLVTCLSKSGVKVLRWLAGLCIVGGVFALMGLTNLNFRSHSPLGMSISPYKGLSQVSRFPNSRVIFSRWNAISRLDVVADAGTHQLPGLSYLYPQLPPPQDGISLDANTVQAITLVSPVDFSAAAYLPEALAFDLQPQANVLVMEPGGGLGVLQALAGGARRVTVVVENALVAQAIESTTPDYNIYAHPQVNLIHESARVYLQSKADQFEIIYLPLTDAYRPVASGAYSLSEEYSLTVEAFQAALSLLEPDGLLVFTRWMQMPPSESLRAIATLVEALKRSESVPAPEALVVYRGIQTVTVLARPTGWSNEMLASARAFAEKRKFDLVWLPGIQEQEVNRYNRLPEASFYLAVRELLTTADREAFYEAYAYQITPPRDDKPFFFHFFKWAQTPEVLASLGHTWQPFGGSGYLVLLALLSLTVILSLGLILLPLLWSRKAKGAFQPGLGTVLLYFSLLGIAFLFIEIPLIQRWVLLLGQPTYAFTVVVATLLLFSGLGSSLARANWLPRRTVFVLLAFLSLLVPFGVSVILDAVLGWPIWARFFVAVLSLAPLGLLMGLPFPLGLAWMEAKASDWIPWAWAVNGCVSVVASILAAMLSLSYGFSSVLFLGAGAYTGALGMYVWMVKISDPR